MNDTVYIIGISKTKIMVLLIITELICGNTYHLYLQVVIFWIVVEIYSFHILAIKTEERRR